MQDNRSAAGPATTTGVPRDRSRNTMTVVGIAALVLALVALAVVFIDVDTAGEVRAPNVSVSGGELPSVDVDTADIDVGRKQMTVDVPTVEVTEPKADATKN